MDVISILKSDHKEVDALFEEFNGCSEKANKSKAKIFAKIDALLTLHALAEEAILYPQLKKVALLRHNSLEAFEEHRLVKQMLAELESLEAGTEEFSAKFKVLQDLVTHHVEEEESEIFKAMKSQFNKVELSEMGEAIIRFKASTLEGGKGKDRVAS